MGKSAFTLNIAENVASNGGAVLLITPEMSGESLVLRSLLGGADVSLYDLTKEDLVEVKYYADKLKRLPIAIYDSGVVSASDVRAKATEAIIKYPELALIVVDYLQLMKPEEGQNREQEISSMSREYKQLARDLNIPIIVLSQLNRKVEERTTKRPQLSDIRESGAVEQDADKVIFIYRDEYYNPDDIEAKGRAEIIIAKNRNGRTGKFDLGFNARRIRFENLDTFHGDYNDPSEAG